jgi:hypothetical protein
MSKKDINQLVDSWHQAASEADFDTYFSLMATDARFLGTAAEENWSKEAFMKFSKPYFDKGKAWDFKVLDRNIYFSKDKNTIWFDERLDTWMGICSGSGVLIKENENWEIKHYVLSLLIPNETVEAVKSLNDSINKEILTRLNK